MLVLTCRLNGVAISTENGTVHVRVLTNFDPSQLTNSSTKTEGSLVTIRILYAVIAAPLLDSGGVQEITTELTLVVVVGGDG